MQFVIDQRLVEVEKVSSPLKPEIAVACSVQHNRRQSQYQILYINHANLTRSVGNSIVSLIFLR
jgi:hypothetical protein